MTALLADRQVVVYGAGGALGAAIAERFASERAYVHLVGRTAGPLERAADAIAARGGKATTAVLDALDAGAVEVHLDSLPRVDVSFNLISRGDVHGTPLLEMDAPSVMAPVVTGVQANFITARAAARRMVGQGCGVILWIGSGSSTGAAPGMGGTGPADAATDNLMRQLAREIGPQGVRVCGIWTAGVPETFGREHHTNEVRRASRVTAERVDALIGARSMLARAPRLSEVTDAAAFLACDQSAGMTGSILNVTCGLVTER